MAKRRFVSKAAFVSLAMGTSLFALGGTEFATPVSTPSFDCGTARIRWRRSGFNTLGAHLHRPESKQLSWIEH